MVKINVTCWNPCNCLFFLIQCLQHLEGVFNDILDRVVLGAQLVLSQIKQRLLGAVQHLVHIFLGLIPLGNNLGGNRDQAAVQRPLLHNFAVVADIGCCRHIVHQRGQIGSTAAAVQISPPFKGLGQGDQVAGFAAF